ncbi:hypothetical protein M8C21_020491, partial [Ambrosia artemisiifolia]
TLCKGNEQITAFGFTRALLYTVWKDVLITGLLALASSLSSFVGPYLIETFVQYLSGQRAYKNQGFVLVVVFLVSKIIECFSHRHWCFKLQQVGIKARSAIVAIIYQKGLTTFRKSKQGNSSGEIITFMAVDAERIGDYAWYMHDFWLVFVQVGVALVLLYKNLGLAFIASLITTILVLLANLPLGNILEKLQDDLMKSKDKRMKSTSETLRNMRILKLQGWEMKFLSKIIKLRDEEEGALKKYMYTLSVTSFIFWGAPIAVAVVTFATCLFAGIPLESGKVLSALATFKILQEPIYKLPDSISAFFQTKVALKRIVTYLRLKDIDCNAINKVTHGHTEAAVEIINGNFSWDLDVSVNPTLKDINIRVNHGMRVAVCGTVGSGKSSLLSCILGEMSKISGSVKVEGSKAYVAQSPWIQSGTIEDNILFGREMYRGRYENILEACSLKKDLENLSFGDQTVIGERGINLSGDLILVMRDGRITQAGKYSDILNSKSDLMDLVGAHKEALSEINTIGRSFQEQTGSSKQNTNDSPDGIPEDIAHSKAQLVQEEEREKGRVGISVYWRYITIAYGGALAPFILLVQIVFQTLQIASNYWMASASPVSASDPAKVTGSTLIMASTDQSAFHAAAAMEWLGIRLDMLSAFTFAAFLIFLISIPKGTINPSIAGLAATYGLTLNMLQGWYSSIPAEPPLIIESNRPDDQWPSHGEVNIHNLQVLYQDLSMDSSRTIRSNLDPLEEYTDDMIWEVLDKCHLGVEVLNKELKLDSPVTENGENCSVGQRQLVCLGRVLLKRTKVLVLDEATASVDTATDAMIQQTLEKHFNDSTVIMIAHRVTSVLNSDKVLVLEQGLIDEYDSPIKLLEDKSSSFAKLVGESDLKSMRVNVLSPIR